MFNTDHLRFLYKNISNWRTEFVEIFNINVAGCLDMTNTFLPLLQAPSNPEGTNRQVGSSAVINISSLLGSCEGSGRFTTTSYQCSKVAVNMLTKCQAAASPTIKFIAIHPGWVSRFIMRMLNFNFSSILIITKTILGIRTQTLSIYRFKLIWVVRKIAPHLWPLRTQQKVSLILQANFHWNNLEHFSVGRGKRFHIRRQGLCRFGNCPQKHFYI